MRPQDLMQVQMEAAKEWGDFWIGGAVGQGRRSAARPPLHGRGVAGRCLLPLGPRRLSARVQAVARHGRPRAAGDEQTQATVRLLLDQYLNAISPANFAFTNPDVVARTKETKGANLVQGFANLLEDIGAGKGIVKRRTDESVFVKGKTIAATPGSVVYRERAVPADPVQSDDRQGRGRASALRAAAGEPLLHDRPHAQAEPGQMAGRRGPHACS